MIRRPRLTPLTAVAAAAVLSLSLTACGGSDGGGSDGGSSTEPPSQAELDAFQEQAGTDAKSIADAVVAEYQSSGSYPESAEGLGTLSEGNELGGYETDGTSAQVCVEHVVDGEPVTFVSWYVDATAEPARSSELSSGLNAGCS